MGKKLLGKRGIASVNGGFPCPNSECPHSVKGLTNSSVSAFESAQACHDHLKRCHKRLAQQFANLSQSDFAAITEARRHSNNEKAAHRNKKSRERKAEAKVPIVIGVCTHFASELAVTTRTDAIQAVQGIIAKGWYPLEQNSQLKHIDCRKCNINIALAAYQDAPGAGHTFVPEASDLTCVWCKGGADLMVPLLCKDGTKLVLGVLKSCRVECLQPSSVEDLDQVQPTCAPTPLTEFEEGVSLDDFLETLRPYADNDVTPTESQFRDNITKNFVKGDYQRFNFNPKEGTNVMLEELRSAQPDDFTAGNAGWTDNARNSLVLLYSHYKGRQDKKLGTRVHLDVTEASNVAYRLRQFPGHVAWFKRGLTSDVLAIWIFIRPSQIAMAAAQLEHMGLVLTELQRPLNDAELEQLRQAGIELMVVKQRHGDLVTVPPGWMHQVTNLVPNIKFAWDRRVIAHMPAYPRVHALISSHMKDSNAEDYVGFATCCANAVLKKVI